MDTILPAIREITPVNIVVREITPVNSVIREITPLKHCDKGNNSFETL